MGLLSRQPGWREGWPSCRSQDGHLVAASAHSAPFPASSQPIWIFPGNVRVPSLSQTSCLRLSLVLEMGPTCTQRHTKNFHGCLVCQGCPVRVQRGLGVGGGTSTRSSQKWQEAGNIFGDYCGQGTPVDIYQLLVVKHSLSTLALLEERPAF